MIRMLRQEARELRNAMKNDPSHDPTLKAALAQDSFWIMVTWRWRCAARRLRIPLVNHLLRRIQTIAFGIELGNDIELGPGVFFVHPVGVVVGGTARVGARVRFMGSNTVGTARNDGCPTVEDDVIVGAGARILGPVCVGAGATLGANAVVLSDIPRGAVAVGLPARVVRQSAGADATHLV